MDSCDFDGNSDVYGLGIRLGLYFQCISTLIAGEIAPEELNGFLDVNTSFTSSVLFVLIYVTATKGDTLDSGSLYAVEVFILMMLCVAGWSCELISIPDGDDERGMVFRGLAFGAGLITLHIYGFWFYCVGMDRMARLSCGDEIFVFARTNLFGPFRIFAIVIHSIMTLILLGLVFNASGAQAKVAAFLYRMWRALFPEPEYEPVAGIGDGRSKPEAPAQQSPVPAAPPQSAASYEAEGKLGRFTIFFLFVVPSIVIIEVTIKYNHIQGVQTVNTTGQLIPLFIGILGFLQLLSRVEVRKGVRVLICELRSPALKVEANSDVPAQCSGGGNGPGSETEEPKDEEADTGTRRAGDIQGIQPNATDALAVRNTIQGKGPGGDTEK